MINEKHLLALLNLWKKNIAERGTHWNVSQWLDRVIEEINTMPKVGEWIPCKRELPKTLGVYQVKRVVYEGYFENYIVTCAYFDGQNTWHNDNRVNHGRPYLTDVIAWKTLDEPYREDDES